jgi:DNA-binding NtrC family response regulator
MKRIILVDDEQPVLKVLMRLFGSEHEVITETDPQLAWSLLEKQSFDLMITDIRMEPIDGLQLFKHAKQVCPQMPVIMLTGYGTKESYKEAQGLGVFGFMNKPFKLVELRSMVENALSRDRLSPADITVTHDQPKDSADWLSSEQFVAESKPMQVVREKVAQLMNKETPVLLCGENGTGKTRIANILHAISNRKDGPFISINCASLPDPLLDLELFGHTKEAFKAAPDGCCGILEETATGAAYLKEITWLSERLQIKLKDAIGNQSFFRIKGDEPIPFRSRLIVSAIGQADQIKLEEHLDAELLARMANWDCIVIPPLRERQEDILPLMLQFMSEDEGQEAGWRVEEEALPILQNHGWPQNLPELRDFTKQAMSICSEKTISRTAVESLLSR